MEIMFPVWPDSQDIEIAKSEIRVLKGTSIALVDDNFDAEFTDEVERMLREDYGADVRRFPKPWGSHPSPKELIEQAAQCQLAIVGIAL